jgi:hypothetical protein
MVLLLYLNLNPKKKNLKAYKSSLEKLNNTISVLILWVVAAWD